MESNQLDAFRQALIANKEEIEQLNNSGKKSADTVTLDQARVGRLSRMDALQAQQMAQETARRRQVQLQRIDSALQRMETGDYGYCFICREELSSARLDFDPASTRCIGCMNN